MAIALSGRTISVDEANLYAIEHDLFTNDNELSPQNGVKLVNGLIGEDCDKELVYTAELKLNPDEYAPALLFLEDRQEKYFVTGRIYTNDSKNKKYYQHTLNINSNSVFEDSDLQNSNKLNIKLNDTSNACRQQLHKDVRDNKMLYMYAFEVVEKKSK